MDKVTRRPSRYWGTGLTECVGNSANGLESVDRSDKSRVNMSAKKKTYVTGTGPPLIQVYRMQWHLQEKQEVNTD